MPSKTLEPALDRIGSEVYSAHYATRRTLQLCLAASGLFNLGLLWSTVTLAGRPIQYRYIKIDELGRATPIQYSDLKFTPTEGIIVQQLSLWAEHRYKLLKNSVVQEYPLSYSFLSDVLSSELMDADRKNRTTAKIVTGDTEESDVRINNIQILSLGKELIHGKPVHRGTALIDLHKIFSPHASPNPRTEHWTIAVTYYLAPDEVAKKAALDPQYEVTNPLGLVITDFHESQSIK
jgi:type IV secretion system protein VirB5